TDGSSGGNVDAGSESEVLQYAVVEDVGEVTVGDLLAILVQHAGLKLSTEKSEAAGREIEQGGDAGVVLAVVVAVGSLEISEDSGDGVIGAQLPVVREGFVDLDDHGPVFVNGIHESVGDAVGDGGTGGGAMSRHRIS